MASKTEVFQQVQVLCEVPISPQLSDGISDGRTFNVVYETMKKSFLSEFV